MPRKNEKPETVESEYITVGQAAIILNMTVQSIYTALERGWLNQYREAEGSAIKVSREQVMEWKEYRELEPPWRIRNGKE